MFTLKITKTEPTKLEEEIERLLEEMKTKETDSPEYSKMADQLAKIYKLKETDFRKRVSPDTWAIIGGNILGIVTIVGYERAHIITSKALGMVMKIAK